MRSEMKERLDLRKGKRLLAVLLAIACILCQSKTSITVDAQTNQKKLHIVFALDVSGSMNNKDANKTALQVVKMLADMCNGSENELGFVAYNDSIAYSYDMTACNEKGIDKLKQYVSKVKYDGETDIGLGLKEAVKMSTSRVSKDSESVVILLSDGKTDLTHSRKKRTIKDSEQDMEDALTMAKEQNVTIYPIRLNTKFDTKVDYLSEVAKATNGTSSVAFSPLELVDIVQSIVSRYQIPPLHNVTTMSGNDNLQEVKIDLKNEYVEKTRIYVLSTNKVSYVSLVGADSNVTYDKTKRYSIVETGALKETDSVKLYFRGKKKSEILVYTQQFYSLEPVVALEPTNTRDSYADILFQFHDTNTGMEAEDEVLYQNMQVQCTLRSMEDGSEKGLSYEKTSKGIAIQEALSKIGTYQLELSYTGDYLSGTFQSDVFRVESKEAKCLPSMEDTVCIKEKGKTFDLRDVFSDVKSELKEYSVVSVKGNGTEASIDGEQLICKFEKSGDTSFLIEAADENQDLYQVSICIHTKTFWQMYQVVIVGCALGGLILCTALLGFITLRKNKKVHNQSKVPFAGTMIGYFMNLKSVNDLPALKWNLYDYQVSGVSMSDLLLDLGIPDRFVGADKIWFYPKSENSIELLHNLQGSIFIGTKMISKDTPVTVYSGEKIFISFDESGIELELRYFVD